jgi:hypothetical protein
LTVGITESHQLQLAATIFEINTELTDHLLVEWFEIVVEANLVYLDFVEFWMRHLKRKFAIVGQEQNTRTVGVEATNGLEGVVVRRN